MYRHRKKMAHSCGMAALCLVASAFSVQAQELTPDRNELTVAAGVAVTPSYTGSDDYVVRPGALLRGKVDGFSFFARGTNLHMDLIRDTGQDGWDLSLGPIAGVRLNRTGSIRDDRVRALGELDTAVELGAWAGISKTGVLTSAYDNLSFRIAYVADVAGAHDSYLITPAIEYVMPLSQRTLVGLSLSADYVGKGYGRYYFDISPAGSQASGLAPYARGGKAGFADIGLNLTAAQSLSGDLRKGWALFAVGGHSWLLDRYADSPIVRDAGSRSQWLGGLGVAYTF